MPSPLAIARVLPFVLLLTVMIIYSGPIETADLYEEPIFDCGSDEYEDLQMMCATRYDLISEDRYGIY